MSTATTTGAAAAVTHIFVFRHVAEVAAGCKLQGGADCNAGDESDDDGEYDCDNVDAADDGDDDDDDENWTVIGGFANADPTVKSDPRYFCADAWS